MLHICMTETSTDVLPCLYVVGKMNVCSREFWLNSSKTLWFHVYIYTKDKVVWWFSLPKDTPQNFLKPWALLLSWKCDLNVKYMQVFRDAPMPFDEAFCELCPFKCYHRYLKTALRKTARCKESGNLEAGLSSAGLTWNDFPQISSYWSPKKKSLLNGSMSVCCK